MDPTACLERFMAACAEDNRDEALYALDDLRIWLQNGGFLPNVSDTLANRQAIGRGERAKGEREEG